MEQRLNRIWSTAEQVEKACYDGKVYRDISEFNDVERDLLLVNMYALVDIANDVMKEIKELKAIDK